MYLQLIAINFCSIGIAFIDQLKEIPEIVDKILINNAQETLTSVRARLSVLNNSLHNELIINGYERQLKDAIILKRVSFFEILTMRAFKIYHEIIHCFQIASGSYTILVCKESAFIATTVASTKPEFIYTTIASPAETESTTSSFIVAKTKVTIFIS